ncbi:MAG: hypothetical protein BGO57_13215 [Sphingomonadales bacterium 63-6]|nr:MAG: hypothetical protein BGO57_13215 [Sphingomonadales bacterium 63-6]
METPDPNQPQTDLQAQPEKAPVLEHVPLQEPIRRGTQVIASIDVRKPKAKELRGLTLQAIQQGEVNTMIALIPRITVPPLLPHEVEEMDPADLLSLGGAISGFFYTSADKEMLAKVLGQIEQETPNS